MNIKSFLSSKKFRVVIFLVVGLAILAGVFKIGEFVGARKASFSYRWGENYRMNFEGMRRGIPPEFPQGFPQEGFLSSHGAFGQIAKIENNFITITSSKDAEKIVVVDNKTQIRNFRSPAAIGDLHIGDSIAVIGKPNDKGQIVAEIIRILPLAPSGGPKNATGTNQ